LVGSEIQCQTRGDPTCRFIISSSNTIHANVGKYCDERSVATEARKKIFIPSFLDSNKNYSVTSSGVASQSKGKRLVIISDCGRRYLNPSMLTKEKVGS